MVIMILYIWLVVEPTPLKNDGVRRSSVGMMKFPRYGNKKCSKPPSRYIVIPIINRY